MLDDGAALSGTLPVGLLSKPSGSAVDKEQGGFWGAGEEETGQHSKEQLCPGPAWLLVWVGFSACVDTKELWQRFLQGAN